MPLQIYDNTDPSAPALLSTVTFPRPANVFRCQHLALADGDRLLATHHGDETSPPWIGLADIADLSAPAGLAAWSDGATALEGVAARGATAYVAAHGAGVYSFDLSDDKLEAPVALDGPDGEARSLARWEQRLAVGTTGGEVQILDLESGLMDRYPVSGPVQDLLWLDADTLLAACGASGLDRLDLAADTVSHQDTAAPLVDLTALPDGVVAAAAWSEVMVLDGATLDLLGVEDPAGPGEEALVLAVDATGAWLTVGEWSTYAVYEWDPTVAAPDLDLDVRRVELGDAASGERELASLVLHNRGPVALDVQAITADDPAITISPTALQVAAGGAAAVEVAWASDGAPLSATLRIESDDPDEPTLSLAVRANTPGLGVGDPLPAFSYLAFNGDETWHSDDLGGPALLSYFATF